MARLPDDTLTRGYMEKNIVYERVLDQPAIAASAIPTIPLDGTASSAAYVK